MESAAVVRFCAGPCSTSHSSPGIRRVVPCAKPVRKRCERWLRGNSEPDASKIIFEGMVEGQEEVAGPIGAPREATSASMLDQHRVVSLRIAHTYRGEVAGTVSVSMRGGEGDCGFDFETCSQYLVPDLQFSVGKVRVHRVLFHIVSADGSLLALEKFGVSIDAPERDALPYHLTQTRNINGDLPAGYVPPGNYWCRLICVRI